MALILPTFHSIIKNQTLPLMPDTRTKSIVASNKIKLIIKPKNLEVTGFSKAAQRLFTSSQLSGKKIFLTDLFPSKKINKEFEKFRKSSKLKQIEIDSIKINNSKVEKIFSLKAKVINSGKEKLIECTLTQIPSKIITKKITSEKISIDVPSIQIKPGKFAASFSDITEKRKVYEELEKSELKFKSLFDFANDAIFLMDEEIFIDCNLKTLDLFGCKKEEIIGKPPYVFSPEMQPDNRTSKEKALEKITLALTGKPQRFEWKHKKLSGELFDTEVSLNRIVLGEKTLLQAIVRDITERKKNEEQISMLAHAIKSISESVCITDMDGKIIFVNNSFCNSYSYTYEEILGQPISTLISDKNPENILIQILPATLRGGWNGELKSRRKDGSEFLTSISTSVISRRF